MKRLLYIRYFESEFTELPDNLVLIIGFAWILGFHLIRGCGKCEWII